MVKIKLIFFLYLLSTIFLNEIFCKLDKERVLIAINCGGPHFTDSNGIEYMKVKLN